MEDKIIIDNPRMIDETADIDQNGNDIDRNEEDNVCVYAQLNINVEAVLRRLYNIISKYGEANEANELSFESEVATLLKQVDPYDEYWLKHESEKSGKHSVHAVKLIERFIETLEEIPDGCAECFPFETIDELKKEYGIE